MSRRLSTVAAISSSDAAPAAPRPATQTRSGRKSFGTAFSHGARDGGSAAAPSMAGLQLNAMYSAVIKLSAENKINIKNSWSLPLIDHMESLILNNGNGASGKKAAPAAASKPSAKPSSKPAGKGGRAARKGGRKPVDDSDEDDDLEVDMLGESEDEEEDDDGGDKVAPLGRKGAAGGAGAASGAGAPASAAGSTSSGSSALVSAPSVAYDAAMLNFSRASCALDASVKIYSCRVDDVYATSYRVLDTITRGATTGKKGAGAGGDDDEEGAPGGKGGDGDADSDDEEEDGEGDDEAGGRKGIKKRGGGKRGDRKAGAAQESATLVPAHQLASITLSSGGLESALQVDPLYHKLANGYDEAGMAGMLLHRLTVSSGTRLTFDSTDTTDVDGETAASLAAAAAAAADAPWGAAPALSSGGFLSAREAQCLWDALATGPAFAGSKFAVRPGAIGRGAAGAADSDGDASAAPSSWSQLLAPSVAAPAMSHLAAAISGLHVSPGLQQLQDSYEQHASTLGLPFVWPAAGVATATDSGLPCFGPDLAAWGTPAPLMPDSAAGRLGMTTAAAAAMMASIGAAATAAAAPAPAAAGPAAILEPSVSAAAAVSSPQSPAAAAASPVGAAAEASAAPGAVDGGDASASAAAAVAAAINGAYDDHDGGDGYVGGGGGDDGIGGGYDDDDHAGGGSTFDSVGVSAHDAGSGGRRRSSAAAGGSFGVIGEGEDGDKEQPLLLPGIDVVALTAAATAGAANAPGTSRKRGGGGVNQLNTLLLMSAAKGGAAGGLLATAQKHWRFKQAALRGAEASGALSSAAAAAAAIAAAADEDGDDPDGAKAAAAEALAAMVAENEEAGGKGAKGKGRKGKFTLDFSAVGTPEGDTPATAFVKAKRIGAGTAASRAKLPRSAAAASKTAGAERDSEQLTAGALERAAASGAHQHLIPLPLWPADVLPGGSLRPHAYAAAPAQASGSVSKPAAASDPALTQVLCLSLRPTLPLAIPAHTTTAVHAEAGSVPPASALAPVFSAVARACGGRLPSAADSSSFGSPSRAGVGYSGGGGGYDEDDGDADPSGGVWNDGDYGIGGDDGGPMPSSSGADTLRYGDAAFASDATADAGAAAMPAAGAAATSGGAASVALLGPVRVVERIAVKYDTVAKRVNVRALKADMWSVLEARLQAVKVADAAAAVAVVAAAGASGSGALQAAAVEHAQAQLLLHHDAVEAYNKRRVALTEASATAAFTDSSKADSASAGGGSAAGFSMVASEAALVGGDEDETVAAVMTRRGGGAPAAGKASTAPQLPIASLTRAGSTPLPTFSSLVKALAPTASDAVTIPFYFITLLHLCNEHGLVLLPLTLPPGAAPDSLDLLADFAVAQLQP